MLSGYRLIGSIIFTGTYGFKMYHPDNYVKLAQYGYNTEHFLSARKTSNNTIENRKSLRASRFSGHYLCV